MNAHETEIQQQAELKPEGSTKAGFDVFVDDNFHFMNEDERYSAGTFDTYEEAVANTKTIWRVLKPTKWPWRSNLLI